MDTFLRDLLSAVNVDVPDDKSSLTSLYDTALRTVLDSHAPIKERHVILRSKAPDCKLIKMSTGRSARHIIST